MNFISTFDELNKLYEEADLERNNQSITENFDNEKGVKSWTAKSINFYTQAAKDLGLENLEMKTMPFPNKGVDLSAIKDGKKLETTDIGPVEVKSLEQAKEYLKDVFYLEESCDKKKLTEATEDEETEIVDDEVPAEEAPAEELAEEEPKQVIIECSKCGALIIKDEADIVVNEESDLVNVEDECKFCEETEGYKIVGVVAPYEAAAAEEEPVVDEEPIDEAAKKPENAEAEELEELFDAKLNVDAENFGGSNNVVSILNPGLESVDTKKIASEDDEELEELFDVGLDINAKDFGGTGNDVSVL